VLLADDLVEVAGPHAAGQRRLGRHPGVGRLGKEVIAGGHEGG
jgi:hypothetical protein